MLDNFQIPDQAASEAVKSIDKHLGETYDKIINVPVQALGEGLAGVFKLVFSPFRFFGSAADMFFEHKLNVYAKELEEKENSIPNDKKVEPDFHTVSLALDNSKFCVTNDDLRRMFVNLIGSTMNEDKKDKAHPAFAEIIKQMNTLDAHVLNSFLTLRRQPIMNVRIKDMKSSFITLQFSDVYDTPKKTTDDLHNLSSSITNLNRLGLVNISYIEPLSDRKYNTLCERFVEYFKIDMSQLLIKKGKVELTHLGADFINICLSS